jgi:uncharacterized protein YjbJ (UPF0337 family)
MRTPRTGDRRTTIVGRTKMDKDRIEGAVKEGVGNVKEAWGDATDDTSTEWDGKRDQAEGEVQQRWGEAKDSVRDATDDEPEPMNEPR